MNNRRDYGAVLAVAVDKADGNHSDVQARRDGKTNIAAAVAAVQETGLKVGAPKAVMGPSHTFAETLASGMPFGTVAPAAVLEQGYSAPVIPLHRKGQPFNPKLTPQ